MTNAPKKRRTPKAPETLLTRMDFRDYAGLLEWLEGQAKKHVHSPGQEIVHRLLLAFKLDQRRGEKGKLTAREEG